MIYDFKKDDGDIPVPSLEDYKKRLASQLLRSAFFQDEAKEDFDMLRNKTKVILKKDNINFHYS